MMKKIWSIICVFAVIMLLIAGCGNENRSAQVFNPSSPAVKNINLIKPAQESSTKIDFLKNQYKLDVKLDTKLKTLTGKEKLTYVNKSKVPLKEVYFHVYPNAYKEKSTTPSQFGFNQTFPEGFSAGSIDIKDVCTNGKLSDFEISGKDKTILRIPLEKELKPGKKVDLSLDFIVKIPKGKDRLSYYDTSYNFGNWYPIAAEYDNKGWHLDSYYSMGDPFYSTVSNYKVDVTVPKDYIVASTGEAGKEKIKNNLKTYSFSEENVRDFAFTTSNKFKVKEEKVDGINIKCYGLGTDSELSYEMNYAKNSIKTFNKFFGKYPYKTYSVAESSFLTGMEYPGIVFISNDPSYKKSGYYESIVVHETAHQWWYGVIGDDEVNEAWLDESFACYSENIYNESVKSSRGDFLRLKDYYNIYSKANPDKNVILKPVQDFKDDIEYSTLVYYKGAVMLDDLREKIGDEEFFKIIQTYYSRYKYRITTTEDFIGVVNEITGENWNNYFDKWLKGQ